LHKNANPTHFYIAYIEITFAEIIFRITSSIPRLVKTTRTTLTFSFIFTQQSKNKGKKDQIKQVHHEQAVVAEDRHVLLSHLWRTTVFDLE
jgi:hypothetical protein